MIYGAEYGAALKVCYRCETPKPKLSGECYYCGEPGCDECLELQTEAMPDPQTGDRGDRFVCERCNEQVKESVA